METLDDIEELKQCYENLGLDKLQFSLKKPKTESTEHEARGILMDFLIGMLAKP